jgi:hypothetical protein
MSNHMVTLLLYLVFLKPFHMLIEMVTLLLYHILRPFHMIYIYIIITYMFILHVMRNI